MIWDTGRVCLINGALLWKFLAKPLRNGSEKRENDCALEKFYTSFRFLSPRFRAAVSLVLLWRKFEMSLMIDYMGKYGVEDRVKHRTLRNFAVKKM